MLYLDASAFFKRYLYEDGAADVFDAMNADHEWLSSPVTRVETARSLALRVHSDDQVRAFQQFDADWRLVSEIELDDVVRDDATRIARSLSLRPLDAIHLASAIRAGGPELTMLTFDDQLAAAAREHGIPTLP